MANTAEVFYRYLIILQLIPHHPASITTSALLARLQDYGIQLTERSLQRDLSGRLSLYFPLICDDTSRPFHWSLDRDYKLVISDDSRGHERASAHIPNNKAA